MRSLHQSMQNKNQFAPAAIKASNNKNRQSKKNRSVSSASSETRQKYHEARFLPPINMRQEG